MKIEIPDFIMNNLLEEDKEFIYNLKKEIINLKENGNKYTSIVHIECLIGGTIYELYKDGKKTFKQTYIELDETL